MAAWGTISEIKPRKSSSRRYQVWIGEEVALEADQEVIVQAGLYPGRALSVEEVAQIREADRVLEASRQAMRLLAHRGRSRQQLVRALRRKRYSEAEIGRALERLERAGLINDEALARQLAEYYARFRGQGRRAVMHRLLQAGLEASLAEAVLAEFADEKSEEERARQAARRFLARAGQEESLRRRARLYDHLQRRGFDASLCRQVTEELVADEDSDIDD